MPTRKNLLFISHRLSWPLNKGEKIRGWHVINHLAKSYNVHFGCVVDDPADMAHVAHVGAVCAAIGAFPTQRRTQLLRALLHARPGRPLMPDFYHAPELQTWVDAQLAAKKFDVIYIFSVAMGRYVLDRVLPNQTAPRFILDAQDIDSEKWAAYAQTAAWPKSLFWAREARTLLAYERHAARACAHSFFVSEAEAAHFRTLAPECATTVHAVENGVDLARFNANLDFPTPYKTPAPKLVFTGNMDYWPNADAAIWFAHEVMPLLRAQHKKIEFWAVGANPGEDVKSLADLPGVFVTGRVEDVRPYVAHADMVVCPLRIARGIQNKVLEGMALGKVVIASPQAFEGVRAVAGEDLLVADGAAAFVQTIAAVLAGQHGEIGSNGRLAMERGYAWDAVMAVMDPYLLPA